MSIERAKEALQKIMQDPELGKKIINVKSDKEAIELLAAHGFKFTQEEFDKAKHELRTLSEKELAGVSGGGGDATTAAAFSAAAGATAAASAF
jgi:predicted ribosomally synthesized peptide with nif11-like leader